MGRLQSSDFVILATFAVIAICGSGLILFAVAGRVDSPAPTRGAATYTPTATSTAAGPTPSTTDTTETTPSQIPTATPEVKVAKEGTVSGLDQVEPWQGDERINALVMGIDRRNDEQDASRTDTMLVVTMDPSTMTAGMLSIPRDLWVRIPGHGEERINAAHYLGEIDDHPGGGPALAVKTVQRNLEVPIHHYVRVDFEAFQRLVDLIGGIDVDVEETIVDPGYPDEAYGYDPLYIPAGQHHFDGETALKYARTRHTGGGDLDRARRQQQVVLAIFEQAKRPGVMIKVVSQAPEIWRTLQGSVMTDLTLRQVIALAHLAVKMDREDVRHAVIGENCTRPWTTPEGQKVLIPVRGQIRTLMGYVFGTEAPASQR